MKTMAIRVQAEGESACEGVPQYQLMCALHYTSGTATPATETSQSLVPGEFR